MSDRELERLRQKKLWELRRQFERKTEEAKQEAQAEKEKPINPQEILRNSLVDRGLEVLNAAKSQHPQAASQVEQTLGKLIVEGKISGKISGEELYGLFLRLGLKIRLQTRIQVFEHGRAKSLEEKIKEETSE